MGQSLHDTLLFLSVNKFLKSTVGDKKKFIWTSQEIRVPVDILVLYFQISNSAKKIVILIVMVSF